MRKVILFSVLFIIITVISFGQSTTSSNILSGDVLPSQPDQYLGSSNAADLIFKTDNRERLRLLSTGNFGIGTNNPSALLHTLTTGPKTTASTGVLFSNTSISSTASINKSGLEISSTGIWNGASAKNIGLYISSVTGGTNNYDAIFNGGGNVGIGNIAPLEKLHVTGNVRISSLTGTGSRMVQANANGNLIPMTAGTASQVLLGTGVWGNVPSGGGNWSTTGNTGTTPGTNFIGTTGAQDLVLKTNNTEYLRINSSGKIGIGMSTGLTEKLNVSNGSCRFVGPFNTLVIGSDDINGSQINSSGTVSNLFINYLSGKNVIIGGDGQDGRPNTGNLYCLHSAIFAEFGGSVGIGTSTPTAKLDIVGDIKASNSLWAENGYFSSNQVSIGANIIGNDEVGVFDNAAQKLIAGFTVFGSGKRYVFGGYEEGEGIIVNPTNNFVGIGTTNPTEKLEVNGCIKTTGAGGLLKLDGFEFQLGCNDGRTNNGVLTNRAMVHAGGFNGKDDLYINYAGDFTDGVIIDGPKTIFNGNVGIGEINPTSKLQVTVDNDATKAFSIYKGTTENFLVLGNGNVWAREVTVTLNSPLGDFVFDKDYKLMPINEFETFVNNNKHLPGIPSAGEVSNNGINVGEFQNLLLQKVEELSLYIIQLEKRISELEK